MNRRALIVTRFSSSRIDHLSSVLDSSTLFCLTLRAIYLKNKYDLSVQGGRPRIDEIDENLESLENVTSIHLTIDPLRQSSTSSTSSSSSSHSQLRSRFNYIPVIIGDQSTRKPMDRTRTNQTSIVQYNVIIYGRKWLFADRFP